MKTITRPGITVTYLNESNQECTADALSVAIATKQGRYVYTYISSGGVYTVEWDKMVAIRMASKDITWCPWCDGQLNSTPCDEVIKEEKGDCHRATPESTQ